MIFDYFSLFVCTILTEISLRQRQILSRKKVLGFIDKGIFQQLDTK